MSSPVFTNDFILSCSLSTPTNETPHNVKNHSNTYICLSSPHITHNSILSASSDSCESDIPKVNNDSHLTITNFDLVTNDLTTGEPISNQECVLMHGDQTDDRPQDDTEINTQCQSIFSQLRNISLDHMRNLKIGSINVNSIRNKFENIHEILGSLLLDCMFINESKLDDSFTNNLYIVDNYTLYRHDRTSHAGGIMGYIRSDIPHTREPDYELDLDFVESIAIKIVINKENWLLMGLYRSPCSNERDFICSLSNVIELALSNFKQIILIGDLNFNLVLKSPLLDFCDQFSLKNVINGFTCYKSIDNPSLIDVCLLNNSKRFLKSFNIFEDAGFSDFHSLIGVITKLHYDVSKPKTVVYRSMKHFDQNNFNNALSSAPFHVMSVFDDIDDQAWFFHKLYTSVVDEIAPIKTRTIKYKPLPYMNSELRKAMFKRNMLRNKFYKTPHKNKLERSKAWEAFRRQRNLVTTLRRKSLQIYFQKRVSVKKDDPKAYYKAISPFLSTKSKNQSTDIQLNAEGEIISQPTQVCEKFNCFFDDAVKDMGLREDLNQDVTTIIESYQDHPSVQYIRNEIMKGKSCSFSFNNINALKLNKAIKSLKPNKASGYDKIPPSMVKSSSVINSHIMTVYNTAFEQSTFPQCFKPAEISPIFKKGDRLSVKNYRPVNILISLSKPFESIIAEQITTYFVENDIMHETISAYRKGFGTNQTLLKMVEDWKHSLDNGEYVGVVASDQSKAFDTLPPGLHIAKLYAYGFSIEACQFVLNYLINRPHRTKLGPFTSSWRYQEKGVAQGSGLGPLLYNLHCNDLPFNVKNCKFYNYADDNTISYSSNNLRDIYYHLHMEVNLLINWFKTNGFKANPDKFQYMLVSKEKKDADGELVINASTTIKCEKDMKILGVIIDDKLNFRSHVNAICKKGNKSINTLRRLTILPQAYKLDIVKTYVKTNFSYCDIVYHFCGKVLADKIEKIQERGLRYAYRDYESSYTILLTKSNLRSLLTDRLISILKEVHKSFHNINPTPTRHLFTKRPVTQRETRQAHDLQIPPFKSITYGKKSVKYLGPKLFNMIELHIRQMPFDDFIAFLKENFTVTDNIIQQHNLTIY